MGFVPSGRCILQGFNKLPPAHALEFDLRSGQSKLWAYWELPPYDSASDGASEDELLDEVEPLLQDAVRQQMVSDVPLGVLLSGGVDSSIIAAMAVRESPHVKTFTARFPGHGQHDETEHARLVARHLGTEHIELEVTSATADLLPEIAHQVDEPLIDSSLIPTWMLSHLVRQHCTVAVGGDGGDELFGGYGHYSRLLRLEKWTARIPWPMRRVVASSASRLLPPGFRGGNLRSWLMAMGEDLESGLPLVALYFDASLRRQLLARDPRWRPEAEAVHVAAVPNGGDLLQRATRMDFGHYLTEDILVKVDRASMRHSLEVRAPMLDQAVVEFAARRVPSRLKASAHQKKILLKRLTERLLPPEFDRHRKQGFSIPLRQWLKRGPFRDLFESVLFARDSVFDKTTVRSLMRGQDHGRGNEERLFALVMFELWRREYGVSV